MYWFILIRKVSVTRPLLLSDFFVYAVVFSETPCAKTYVVSDIRLLYIC